MSVIPYDYEERVYAGVLGKIIGVYVGRPFEGWTHQRIQKELGEIKYYVHEQLGKPLVVVDDDISGTFTFLRAMPDYGNSLALTPQQIGQTWLNYLIEKQTVLWWGGLGNSTEHTAYLRLKAGIPAPESGSMARNGQVVAEQIGAQIFIDGWGMIAPGDPALAADLARRAASVSHDGEAIYGAQVVAAMEAQAFFEPRIDALLDTGLSVIPNDSLIYRLINDLREWRAKYTAWRDTFQRIVENYGYDKYGGNCHIVPNHALIIMALLHCDDSFSKALSIVNTAGWDTDCNSANVGCIMGIKNGLAGLEDGPDWRGPVADRLYLPTADAGRTVTDAVHETYQIVQITRAIARQPTSFPKEGARFHFDLPGAVQGFIPEEGPLSKGTTWVENVVGHSQHGSRSLAMHYRGLADGRVARIVRETFPDLAPVGSYRMVATPTLYSGQTVQARVEADARNQRPVSVRLFIKVFGPEDRLVELYGPSVTLTADTSRMLEWRVESPVGCPIVWIGLEVRSNERADGTLYLDWLTWGGSPRLSLAPPNHAGMRWLEAWTQACSSVLGRTDHDYRLIQDEGTGLLLHGSRDWRDYAFSAALTPHLAKSFGIAGHVQGLRRYYALCLVQGNKAQLVRELDGTRILSETPYTWSLYQTYRFDLEFEGNNLVGRINDRILFEQRDESPLSEGGVALLIEEGRLGCDEVEVRSYG